eukprot:m.252812 g.252812  ORF g.252812 m.252812 type:complete len:61 (+) comp15476_c0_seq6:2531-2713(+)
MIIESRQEVNGMTLHLHWLRVNITIIVFGSIKSSNELSRQVCILASWSLHELAGLVLVCM